MLTFLVAIWYSIGIPGEKETSLLRQQRPEAGPVSATTLEYQGTMAVWLPTVLCGLERCGD